MIYVCSPYRSDVLSIENERVKLVREYVTKLTIERENAFSAVVYTDALLKVNGHRITECELPTDLEVFFITISLIPQRYMFLG